MPMTVNTMSAMVTAGLNNSNKRLLERNMVDVICGCSPIYIYSYGGLKRFKGGIDSGGSWKWENGNAMSK
jgi:hypothetical protein